MAYKIKSAVVCLDPPCHTVFYPVIQSAPTCHTVFYPVIPSAPTCHTVFYPVIQSEAKDLGFLASTFISS